ncbi:MAG: cell division protein ZapE [Acidimicrobiia bacterium]
MTESLVERFPKLSAADLVDRFVPPRRFSGVRFASYVPSPEHPSQFHALEEMKRFTASITAAGDRSSVKKAWFRRGTGDEATNSTAPARYLDGGFGVGKTHLLASLWHEAPKPSAYLTFAELTAIIGFLGMDNAVAAFAGYKALCIDEFELDDVANTLMAVTFLRAIIPGTKVVATSNSLPDRLGEGRFAADDFKREIAAIAAHFDVIRVDGPDYRAKEHIPADPLDPATAERLAASITGTVARNGFDEVLRHLRQVHPVQVGALVDGIDTVVLDGLRPIDNQGDALLFVHFIDEVYDAEVDLIATGCPIAALFSPTFRNGGYRKKYGRCESRLGSLLGASAAATRS